MTFATLLDQVAGDAGDAGGSYRSDARRWLNIVRSYVADKAKWRSAFDADVNITTAAATTDGLYSIGSGYDYISGRYLYDETNDRFIDHESFATLNAIDAAKSTTGPPSWWSDAGVDSSGVRQIYLWPIPDAAYTIRFAGYKLFTDITESNDEDTADPFFGPLATWSACLSAGLRYQHDLNNNEDVQQIALQLKTFEMLITQRRRSNAVDTTSVMQLENVKSRAGSLPVVGRLDPAHYRN